MRVPYSNLVAQSRIWSSCDRRRRKQTRRDDWQAQRFAEFPACFDGQSHGCVLCAARADGRGFF
jgi:hypothetical protein